MFASEMDGSLYLHKLLLHPEPSLCTAACLASPLPEGQDWKCVEIVASWAPNDSAVLVQYHHQMLHTAAARGHYNDDIDAYSDDDAEDDAKDDAEGEPEDPPQHAQVGPFKT